MAFYSNCRVRRLGVDGIFDVIFSPADHDIPKGMTIEQLRKYPAKKYEFTYTKHQSTPGGELKPNKDILLSIVAHVGARVEDCVYVGDSLVKDVAMAKDAGVSDVWAKYGLTQSTDAYQLLREVTHWSAADVEREKKISEREISDKDLIFSIHDFTIHVVLLVPMGGIIGGLLFYFIDRYWYHRLLGGSVRQGLFIEKRYSVDMPEIALTDAIGASSPIKLKRKVTQLLARGIVTDDLYKKTGQIHSTAKIELFYKPIIYIFFFVFIAMLFGGAVLVGKENLFEVGLRKVSSIEWSKPSILPVQSKKAIGDN